MDFKVHFLLLSCWKLGLSFPRPSLTAICVCFIFGGRSVVFFKFFVQGFHDLLIIPVFDCT